MEPDLKLLRDSERVLTKAHRDFQSPGNSALASEFYELRIQAAIFNYDVCYEFVTLWLTEPQGFALNVALKNLVHKLYEYDRAMSSRIVKRILEFADRRGLMIDGASIKTERHKWKEQLGKLQQWSDLRNQAAGRYGKDISRQVALLEQLDREEVFFVAQAFLEFSNFVSKVLANVGRGRIGAQRACRKSRRVLCDNKVTRARLR